MTDSSPFNTRQRVLHEGETRTSLNSWFDSLMFHISCEPRFAKFIDIKWQPSSVPNRGFFDDIPKNQDDKTTLLTAKQKCINLKMLLGWLSIHSPVISAQYIKEEASSLDDIFNRLREHFDCAKSGSKITEIFELTLGTNETRESLWERVYSFVEDSLITKNSNICHNGIPPQQDEPFSPTLLNIAVVIWLNAIHSGLPALVKQRFAIPMKNNTIYSMRTEISDAIPSMLSELNEREGVISYTASNFYRRGRSSNFPSRRGFRRDQNFSRPTAKSPKCCLCEAAGRPGAHTHYFQFCPFLPPEDRKFLKINEIDVLSEPEHDGEPYIDDFQRMQIRQTSDDSPSDTCRVDIISSPSIDVQIKGLKTDIVLDTGAESNLIREDEAKRLGLDVIPTSHRANMADGKSPMVVSGEVHFHAFRSCPTTGHPHALQFDGLVVQNLNCSLLGGMPFLDKNDIYLRPKINSVYVGDCCDFQYVGIRRCSNVRAATILRVPRQECVLPGASISIPVPSEYNNKIVSLEPRCDSNTNAWIGCRFVRPESGFINIENSSEEPMLLKRHTQLCQIRHTQLVSLDNRVSAPPTFSNTPVIKENCVNITVDPVGILSSDKKSMIVESNEEFSEVFSPSIGCYNGQSGRFFHKINMSDSLPKQRRGRIPMYSRNNLEQLQIKFDELLAQGVFTKPEECSVTAEYVSPSFLISKQSGGHRLVTAFVELGQYAKPQPSVMPKVDDILRHLATYKYLIKADLSQAYYQIPLDKSSYKYVGVCTPFKGVYIYTRAVMGLPGSESALEQLLCKILGDLMTQGSVIKLADDLYIGGDTPQSLNITWRQVLHRLKLNNLKLSASKTVCCPVETEVLGWLWKQGTLSATPHRINALAACQRPKTVKGLRSFIGSYKFLSKVLPRHSDMLDPLEKTCAAADSKSLVMWTDDLVQAFEKAKNHLKDAKVLTLPTPDDKLQIITDASTSTAGLASTLIVLREGKPLLGGVFNAKKTSSQCGWLACELEALGIAAGIKFFGPYLIQSKHQADVLTDSKPCVQAYQKLMRGTFSSSPRVATFLSTISRFHVKLSHIAGSSNILSDYISRNSIECPNQNCQICTFISHLESSVVNSLSVTDILSGQCSIPFTTRSTWVQIQRNCSILKHVHTLLKDGRVPSRKQRGVTDVRRYLNYCKLSNSPSDGLIIVEQEVPFQASRQKIVVPRDIVDGLLTALHLQLRHPSKHQLKQVFCRGFFALDLDQAISRVVEGCHSCAALKKVPTQFKGQSTSPPPDKLGISVAGDIINREGQSIFLLRENVSSLTDGVILGRETAEEVKGGLIQMLSRFRPVLTFRAVVRLDGQTCFQSLSKKCLEHLNIEIGDAKNVNRNPIAERSVSEFHEELCKIRPEGGKISTTELAMILASINSRIRSSGFSALEVWTQRDMYSGDQISINIPKLSESKYTDRVKQHLPSAKYKSRGHIIESPAQVSIGDIVYLVQDRDKTRSRPKYMVSEICDNECFVRKFTHNQFRGKLYRVRLSDLISVPKTVPSQVSSPNLNTWEHCGTDLHNLPYFNTPGAEKGTPDTSYDSDSSQNRETDGDSKSSGTPDLDFNIPHLTDYDNLPTNQNSTDRNKSHVLVPFENNALPRGPREQDAPNEPMPDETVITRRPSRARRPPNYLNDFVVGEDTTD